PMPTLVDLAGMRGEVGGDLGLQRRRQHPTRTITHDLVDQRPAGNRPRWRVLDIGDYRKHGRTLPTRVGARAFTRFLDSDSSGRVSRPTLIHRFRALLIDVLTRALRWSG